MRKLLGAAAIAASAMAASVQAQSAGCGGYYVVKGGDTLSGIANRLYDNAGAWSAIHTGNLPNIGKNPNSIRVGQWLYLTCIKGLPTGLPATIVKEGIGSTLAAARTPNATSLTAVQTASVSAPTPQPPKPATEPETVVARASTDLLSTAPAQVLPKIKLVTADAFKPFTDRSLENGGLMTEVVTAAMNAAVGADAHDTFWINDWGSHLNQMLPAGLMEMAYPWVKPNCEATPNITRCADFVYSKPMFEYLILLFVSQDKPIPFATDDDIVGRTLCRPADYTMTMLDENGRNWLQDDKITLVTPVDPGECFELLVSGEVDGVVLNEFTGREKIAKLGLQNQVEAVASRPVSIAGLHVLIHKSNPNAELLRATINEGLSAIQQDGRYQEIVARHMSTLWAKF